MKSVNTKWVVMAVLALLWLSFTTIYALYFLAIPLGSNVSFETTKFVFLSISAFGVIFSTLLSSFNSLEATQHISDKINFDRIENSFLFMERWESDRLLQARDVFRDIAKNKHALSQKEIETKFASNPELERSVVNFFNFVEEIYLSIIANRVEERLLKEAFAKVFQITYECFFSPYKAIYPSSTTMKNIELLHERWK